MGKKATTRLRRFTAFCDHSLIIPLTDDIFDRAADLWADAYRGCHPRNNVDLLIAATALQRNFMLVTGNGPHFTWVSGLQVVDW